MRVNPYQNVL